MCFVFMQKTAYYMRISDWSSYVCSSDLLSLCLADWTVAAAFAGAEDDTVTGDGSGWTVGVNYAPGPWMLSLAGFSGDSDGPAIAHAGGSGSREASFTTVPPAAGYNTRPSVPDGGVVCHPPRMGARGLGPAQGRPP